MVSCQQKPYSSASASQEVNSPCLWGHTSIWDQLLWCCPSTTSLKVLRQVFKSGSDGTNCWWCVVGPVYTQHDWNEWMGWQFTSEKSIWCLNSTCKFYNIIWYVPPPSNTGKWRFTLGRSFRTQVILQPSQLSWHNHQSRVIFCRIFFVANLVRCLLEIFYISTLSWTLCWQRFTLGSRLLSTHNQPFTDKVSVLQRPKLRIIFWFLKWETGIDTLLHHIGWIKCPCSRKCGFGPPSARHLVECVGIHCHWWSQSLPWVLCFRLLPCWCVHPEPVRISEAG